MAIETQCRTFRTMNRTAPVLAVSARDVVTIGNVAMPESTRDLAADPILVTFPQARHTQRRSARSVDGEREQVAAVADHEAEVSGDGALRGEAVPRLEPR